MAERLHSLIKASAPDLAPRTWYGMPAYAMVSQDINREQTLRQEVQQLKIEVDIAKQRREVSAVTDNEYFRALQSRVKDLRRRDRTPNSPPPSRNRHTA